MPTPPPISLTLLGVRFATGEPYDRLIPLSRIVSLFVGSLAEGKRVSWTTQEKEPFKIPVLVATIDVGGDPSGDGSLQCVEILEPYCADLLDTLNLTAAYQILSDAAEIVGPGTPPLAIRARWETARRDLRDSLLEAVGEV